MTVIILPEDPGLGDDILGVVPNHFSLTDTIRLKLTLEDHYGFPCVVAHTVAPLSQVLDGPLKPI